MKDDNYIRFDWAIKRLLRNKANFGVLEGLLTTLLGEQITIAEMLESESNQNNPADKFNRVDMMALNTKGEYIIIEVQITGGMNYFRRMLYGVSKTITEHMKLGMEYKEVKKVYSINVVYFSMELKDDYVYHGTNEFRGMHTHTVLQVSDKERKSFGISEISDIFPEYYLLCVNNFNTVALTPLDEWISYLKDNEIPANATAPGLAEARQLLLYDQMSQDERYRYENYLKQLSADTTNINDAVRSGRIDGLIEGEAKGRAEGLAEGEVKGRAEGLAEGEVKGRAKGIIEGQRKLIATMRQQGLATEEIALYTGLTLEEVDCLTRLMGKETRYE